MIVDYVYLFGVPLDETDKRNPIIAGLIDGIKIALIVWLYVVVEYPT